MNELGSGRKTIPEFPRATDPDKGRDNSNVIPEMTGDEDPSKGLGIGVKLSPEHRLLFKVAYEQGQAESAKRAAEVKRQSDIEKAKRNVLFDDSDLNAAAKVDLKNVADSIVVTPPRDYKSQPPVDASTINKAWSSIKKMFGGK